LRALGRADLDWDERFQTARSRQLHASALVEILDQTFGSESMNYWSARLGKEALPFGVIQTPEEVVNDPQLYENEIIVPMDDENPSPRRTVASPVGINECARVKPRLAPGLGEHTREILRELAFTEREIAAFREEGVISRPGTEESELR
ncbi:MAG: CoA transferase, partial [Burkholderiaceae bacterium]